MYLCRARIDQLRIKRHNFFKFSKILKSILNSKRKSYFANPWNSLSHNRSKS